MFVYNLKPSTLGEPYLEVRDDETRLFTLQNGVGHCCGATVISHFTRYKRFTPTILNSFLDVVKKCESYRELPWIDQGCFWMPKTLFYFGSKESAPFDQAFIEHPNTKEIYKFTNRGGYSENEITLYCMEVK